MNIPDDYVKKCPDTIPEGLVDWITETVLPRDRTLLYKKGNRKGYCYHCGNYVTALPGEKFLQGAYATCPVCGEEKMIATLEGSSKWSASYIANIATLEKSKDGTLWIRQWHVMRGPYRGITKSSLVEICRWCLVGSPAQAAKWLHENKEAWGMHIERYWCKEWERSKKVVDVFDGNEDFFFPENFSEIVKGTCLEYYDLRIALIAPIRSMLDWARYPAVEKLYKAGYIRLIQDKMQYAGSKKIRWKQNTIEKALKLPLWVLKEKSPAEWSTSGIERMQQIYQLYSSGKITKEEMSLLAHWNHPVYYLERAIGHAKLSNILKYTEGLVDNTRGAWYGDAQIADWRDYLQMAEELGMDLDNKRILFPKNLKKEHDKLIDRRKAKQNKELSLKITEASKKLEKMDYSLGTLLIRPARSWEELNDEGRYNNHCVETYSRRMAAGKTAIFFVRKTDDPDTPFYTLELQDKTVVQCRTKNNVSYTNDPEVKEFVDKWYSTKVLKRKAKAI